MKLLARLLRLAGWLLLLQLAAAIAGPPQWLTDWLNAKDFAPTVTPRNIVVLSGGGIPSGSSLIRLYYAAEFGRGLTGTTFVVAMPTDGDPAQSSVGRMRDELVLRGIPAAAIRLESRGLNTRQQADNIASLLGPIALTEPVLVVTSEFHLRRAVLYFRKAGFTQVAGLNAAGTDAEADPGAWAGLRYGLWNNLVAEIKILRELLALAAGVLTGQL
ncbi:MAG: YdcF family protein [Verrucomicrobiota bacterium]